MLYLQLVGSPVLCDIWLAYSLFTNILPVRASELLTCILEFEYESAVVQALTSDPLTLSECICREQKESRVSVAAEQTIEWQNQWPVLVPKHTVTGCQDAYLRASWWTVPPVCAICAQYQTDCRLFVIGDSHAFELHLDSLRVNDNFIVQKCIAQTLSGCSA